MTLGVIRICRARIAEHVLQHFTNIDCIRGSGLKGAHYINKGAERSMPSRNLQVSRYELRAF